MSFSVGHYVQSVIVQGTVYVGGEKVVTFDAHSGKWQKLPPYKAIDFAMAVLNDTLVLVAGWKNGGTSKELGVWNAQQKAWTNPYPDMHIARSCCSAVVYKEWLVVAGGWDDGRSALSSVEVMNTDSKEWYTGPTTPVPWNRMKTVTVGDMCYFMGGYVKQGAYVNVYSLYLPALALQLATKGSRERCRQIWREFYGLNFIESSPLSVGESLLAVGGKISGIATSAIHLYQPDTGKWVKVGDLPTPRYNCTCAMISEREILVVDDTNRTDIANIS